jgi:hypothetical protein
MTFDVHQEPIQVSFEVLRNAYTRKEYREFLNGRGMLAFRIFGTRTFASAKRWDKDPSRFCFKLADDSDLYVSSQDVEAAFGPLAC